MAVTDYRFSTNSYNASGAQAGSLGWMYPTAIESDDGSSAYGNYITGMDTLVVRRVSMMRGGVIDEAVNKATNNSVGSLGTKTFGGAADLWGATLTPAIINAETFGIAAAYGDLVGATYTTRTNYLVASKLGFNIPLDATINGVEVVIEDVADPAGGGTIQARVDYIKVRVYYTWNAKVYAQGSSNGIVYTEVINPYKPKKSFRHRITTKAGAIMGQWNDLDMEPSFKKQLNNVMGSMALSFARNDLTVFRSIDTLQTDAGEDLLGDDSDPLYANLESVKGVGPGTDLDVNLEYSLTAFDGYFEVLLADDGEPLLTDDYEPFMISNGFPEGLDLFTGYVSKWESEWGGSDKASATILSHSNELANIMLETPDVKVAEAFGWDGANTLGIAGGGPTDNDLLAQTFSFSSQKILSQARFIAKRWGGPSMTELPTLFVSIYQGTPTSPGALLGSGSAVVQSMDYAELIVSFDGYVTIPASTTCHMVLSTDQNKTGGNVTYPITLQVSSNYTDGAAYYWYPDGGWATYTGYDLTFSLWTAGGDTTVPMNSMDPATMLMRVVDFARSRGARINYSVNSIQMTGSTRSYSFKGNTIKEAIDKILELCPADWWYRYDFATNTIYLGPRPTQVTRYLTLKKDIVSLKLSRTIEKIINEVYFSGGQVSTNVNLYKKSSDTASISAWRRGLAKLSDNRVTVSGTATVLSESQIERYKDPIYAGSGTIANTDFPLEEVEPSELIGFRNFGNFVDDLELLLVENTYKPDDMGVVFEMLLPKIAKRVEDIKRDLEAQEQENNPVAPS